MRHVSSWDNRAGLEWGVLVGLDVTSYTCVPMLHVAMDTQIDERPCNDGGSPCPFLPPDSPFKNLYWRLANQLMLPHPLWRNGRALPMTFCGAKGMQNDRDTRAVNHFNYD